MKITFLQEAELEFLDSISYYETEQPGLGQRFKDEVDRTVLWVAERPEVCRLSQAATGGLTCASFRITFHTSFAKRSCG